MLQLVKDFCIDTTRTDPSIEIEDKRVVKSKTHGISKLVEITITPWIKNEWMLRSRRSAAPAAAVKHITGIENGFHTDLIVY